MGTEGNLPEKDKAYITDLKKRAYRDRIAEKGDALDQASEDDTWNILEGKKDYYPMRDRWIMKDSKLLMKHLKEVAWILVEAAKPITKEMAAYGGGTGDSTATRIFREIFEQLERPPKENSPEWSEERTGQLFGVLKHLVCFVLEQDTAYRARAEEIILACGYYAPELRREIEARNPAYFYSMRGAWSAQLVPKETKKE
jgi:hypothetical protein